MPDLTPPVVTRSPFVGSREARSVAPSSGAWLAFVAALLVCLGAGSAWAQSFGLSNLDFNGNGSVAQSTSLEFGPDGRLYVLQLNGTIDVLTIQRNGPDDYVVTASEEILLVKNIPNHDDDGTPNADDKREATGITVVGTALNPVIYATSSDARVGGPSGDKDLDTNSGVITRLTWNGTTWDAVDLVRGLPRSEENHATNGLEFVTVNGTDYLIVCSGGHTNAGSPSTNFAWHTEYALSAAVLSVDLTALELLPVLNDGARDYVYDLPTVDDPTRANANGIGDPNAAGYDGVDVNDPWGGNDGLNQAKIVPGGPVQIFSPGYRNTYDLVVTESGAVYLTENGANGGWGGFPENEGPGGTTTNNFRVGEPGSTGPDPVDGEAKVNNKDHLHLLTNDISTYAWGSFYGGHPTPIRANPAGAGLFTRGIHSSDVGDTNGNGFEDDWFRTQNFDPNGSGEAADASKALPADWPPVPIGLANPVEGDFRNPGGSNPDGPVDDIITIWANNTNGIDEYTASNFGGAMQGDLIAGKSGGTLHRVQLNPDGSLDTLTEDWNSNLGGNPLGVTANGDADPFPGTIWVGTFSSNIVVLEPQDLGSCPLPGEPGYDPNADNDLDGYTNEDEDQNGTDLCNGGSQPNDFDKVAGAPLVSDLNDPDDDGDGIDDSVDVMQLGNPAVGGTDAFPLPVDNELFSDNPVLQGYLGLGFTGLMNNGAANPNWLDWIDQPDAGPNPNDVLGGAVGAMTMQMTDGTAYGLFNDQEKGFQYGVDVPGTGAFTVQGRLLNLGAGFQLYPTGGDAELGIFLGDGTQSNYIELLISGDGVEAFQELGDTPQTSLFDPIAVPNRPTGSVEFELRVDADSGLVEALYGFDGSSLVSLGTIVAGGAVLSAIQTPGTPVMVGLIGSSYAAGVEVEGTWDYLKVLPAQPTVTTPIPDASAPTGSGPQDIDLDVHFDDDQGVGNLTYTIVDVSNPAFGASIVGSTLTITFPGTPATGTITVRATDADGRFVEQTFNVTAAASTPPTVIATIPDQSVAPGAPPRDIGLEAYFDDDQGVGNLTFSVEAISNPAFGASVLGSTLTLTFPAVPEVGTITVRATDPDLQFVEQVFSVTTSDPVVLYRVNAGGPAVAAIDGGIDWEEDTQSLNSQYLTDPGNNKTSSHNVGAYDVSVDLATTPTDLFLTERWDRPTGTNVVYGFPVGAGDYEVRLYLANGFNGTSEPGERIFDILLEGQTTPQLTDIDLSAQFGHQVGAVIVEQLTVNDGLLEIELVHGPIQNPIINGIEILSGGSASVAIDVVPVPDQSSLEGDLINLPVIASGGDTGTFSFSATSLPTGLQIEPTTGLIFGTVATGAAAGSPYLVTITVDDDDADPTDTVDEILTWIVEEPTPTPISVTPIPDQQSSEGGLVSLQVVASGGDTGSFGFQASGLPAGLSIGASTGLISGTIALGAATGSPYVVSVTVDDEDGDATDTVTEVFTWTVDAPTPIDVTPVPDQQSIEGEIVSLQVVASGGDTGSLTYQATNLPAGLSIGTSTGLISGTVAAGASASSPYAVSITVDDGDGDATDVVTELLTWTVNAPTPISVSPVADQLSTEGDVVSLQVVASGGDTGSLDYQASGLPAGLSIGSSTGLITGTIAAGASTSSPYAVSVTVDDGDGDATDAVTENFSWTVNPPAGTTPIDVVPVADQSSTEGDVISLQVVASGGDTGTFDFQATGLPPGLSIAQATGLITGTISAGASTGSPYAVSIDVDDNDADGTDVVTRAFSWTVDAPSTPISVTPIADQSSTEGDAISLQVVASGGDTGTFDFQASGLPTGLSIDATTGLISGTIATGASASSPFAVSITVDDEDGDATDTVTELFSWTVSPAAPQGEALYRVNAGGPAVAAIDGGIDWEEDTKTQNSLHLLDNGNNKTSSHQVGAYDVSVDLATTPTDIFLTERWDRPPGTNVIYGFPVVAGDYEVRLYLANGFNGTSEPGERVFDIEIEGQAFPQLTDIDLSAQFGHRVGGVIVQPITVTDGLLEIELFHGPVENPIVNGIEILPASEPPPLAVDPVADQVSPEGAIVSLAVVASGGDTGSFDFQASGLPSGLSIAPTTGLITGTIALGATAGSPYSVSVSVDDNDADPTDVVTANFSWTVDPQTPINVTPVPDQQTTEGGSVSVQVVASGGDTGSLTFQASGLPAGLSIGSSTGLISGTVSAGAAASSPYSVSITVDDGDGDATDGVTENFTWTVDEPVATPISVDPVPDQQSTEGDPVSLQVVASGGDTGTFDFQATGLPGGLSIGSSTGLISGTVAAGASTSSPYAVSITVDDNDGDATDVVIETFTWTVDAPSTPIDVTPVADQASTEGDAISLQVVASGGDTGTFDFQATGLPTGLSIGASTGLISGTVSAGASAGSPYSVSITVDDNDGDATDTVVEAFSWTVVPDSGGSPQLSIADATVAEDGGSAVFVVSLSQAAASDVSFSFATSNGTAGTKWNRQDYQATSGSDSILAGQLSTTIEIPIFDDIAIEGDETFNVTLSNVSGAVLLDGTAVGTIDEDDGENLSANLVRFDLSSGGNPFDPSSFDIRPSFSFADGPSGLSLVVTGREVLVDAAGQETTTVIAVDVTQTGFGLGVAGVSDLAGTNIIFANQVDGKGIDGTNDGTGDYEELVITVSGAPSVQLETVTFGNGNSDDDFTIDVGGVELVSRITATDPGNLPHDVTSFGVVGNEIVFGVFSNTSSDDYAVKVIEVSVP